MHTPLKTCSHTSIHRPMIAFQCAFITRQHSASGSIWLHCRPGARENPGQVLTGPQTPPPGLLTFLFLPFRIAYPVVQMATQSGKNVYLTVTKESGNSIVLLFKMISTRAASGLYRAITETHAFYRHVSLVTLASLRQSTALRFSGDKGAPTVSFWHCCVSKPCTKFKKLAALETLHFYCSCGVRSSFVLLSPQEVRGLQLQAPSPASFSLPPAQLLPSPKVAPPALAQLLGGLLS